MLWMLLLGCSSADAEEIAAVMLVTGDAHIRREGVDLPASVGTLVDRTDTLITGPDGAIIVQLRNDHLVRVDADLELRVTDIVVLDAPKSAVPPGKQLADFLYPEEADALGTLVTRAERVAGWTSRITAADSVSGVERSYDFQDDADGMVAPQGAPTPEDVREEERIGTMAPDAASPRGSGSSGKRKLKDGYGITGPTEKPKPRATNLNPPAPPPPPPEPKPADARPDGGGGGGGTSAPNPGLNLHPVDAKAEAEPTEAMTIDRAAAQAWFAEGGKHRQCLVDWAAALPVDVDAVRIRVRIQGGIVTRVNLGGGLATPTCVRDALVGAAIAGGDGTFVLEVAIQ
ncbi:MAG: hypothetical protein H6737_24670 [Alphaproteobacteria bacterium]|nr:hypothetical protein [Alphaproteobacteria bacterium]